MHNSILSGNMFYTKNILANVQHKKTLILPHNCNIIWERNLKIKIRILRFARLNPRLQLREGLQLLRRRHRNKRRAQQMISGRLQRPRQACSVCVLFPYKNCMCVNYIHELWYTILHGWLVVYMHTFIMMGNVVGDRPDTFTPPLLPLWRLQFELFANSKSLHEATLMLLKKSCKKEKKIAENRFSTTAILAHSGNQPWYSLVGFYLIDKCEDGVAKITE